MLQRDQFFPTGILSARTPRRKMQLQWQELKEIKWLTTAAKLGRLQEHTTSARSGPRTGP